MAGGRRTAARSQRNMDALSVSQSSPLFILRVMSVICSICRGTATNVCGGAADNASPVGPRIDPAARLSAPIACLVHPRHFRWTITNPLRSNPKIRRGIPSFASPSANMERPPRMPAGPTICCKHQEAQPRPTSSGSGMSSLPSLFASESCADCGFLAIAVITFQTHDNDYTACIRRETQTTSFSVRSCRLSSRDNV